MFWIPMIIKAPVSAHLMNLLYTNICSFMFSLGFTAYFILENNLPLQSALDSRRMVLTDVRMITNDNFGTVYLHLPAVFEITRLFRGRVKHLFTCLLGCWPNLLHVFVSAPLRDAPEAHLPSWLLWVLPIRPPPHHVSLHHFSMYRSELNSKTSLPQSCLFLKVSQLW